MDIDALLDQWNDQWLEYWTKKSKEIDDKTNFWEQEWNRWYTNQTQAIQQSYLDWMQEWELWSSQQKNMMEETAEKWRQMWTMWFYTYINQNQEEIVTWKNKWDADIREWYEGLQDLLSDDAETNIAQQIVLMKKQLEECAYFHKELTESHAIVDILTDNNYQHYTDLLDRVSDIIRDRESFEIQGREYGSDPILDSEGNPIYGASKICII